MVDRAFVADNDAERERLKNVVARLTDEQLSHPMPAGWTVSGVLAHMAQWDSYALYLMTEWSDNGGTPSRHNWKAQDVNWINNSAKPLCLALPPRIAVQLVLDLAEQTDRKVASLSDDLLEQIIAAGPPFNLSRATHRREHLDEIEAALGQIVS